MTLYQQCCCFIMSGMLTSCLGHIASYIAMYHFLVLILNLTSNTKNSAGDGVINQLADF